jgi:hypothetical protein
MKTTTRSFIVALALTLGLLVSAPPAYAEAPLDVDCDLYAATILAVDDFLGTEDEKLGELFAAAILDDAVFDDLNALITFFSGGAIIFNSASQAIATTAKCGLIPLLIGELAD